MPNYVWGSSPDGLLDRFNSRIYEYSGTGQGELDGIRWSMIVHPDDQRAASAAWMAALQSGQPYETPWEEAKLLQRPLPSGVFQVVSVGPREDPPAPPEPSLF